MMKILLRTTYHLHKPQKSCIGFTRHKSTPKVPDPLLAIAPPQNVSSGNSEIVNDAAPPTQIHEDENDYTDTKAASDEDCFLLTQVFDDDETNLSDPLEDSDSQNATINT
eukprot:UN00638